MLMISSVRYPRYPVKNIMIFVFGNVALLCPTPRCLIEVSWTFVLQEQPLSFFRRRKNRYREQEKDNAHTLTHTHILYISSSSLCLYTSRTASFGLSLSAFHLYPPALPLRDHIAANSCKNDQRGFENDGDDILEMLHSKNWGRCRGQLNISRFPPRRYKAAFPPAGLTSSSPLLIFFTLPFFFCLPFFSATHTSMHTHVDEHIHRHKSQVNFMRHICCQSQSGQFRWACAPYGY